MDGKCAVAHIGWAPQHLERLIEAEKDIARSILAVNIGNARSITGFLSVKECASVGAINPPPRNDRAYLKRKKGRV